MNSGRPVARQGGRRGQRCFELRIVQKAQFVHAAQHVLLAQGGAAGIGERVVGRRRFRQSGEHRCLGCGDAGERFAVINLCRSGKTVGALSQKNLIDVELKDLILSELMLNLVSERYFIGFAQNGLLASQEEVTRHLHRDRARALFGASGGIGVCGAQHRQPVDAGVIVKIGIFGCKDRLTHRHRHFSELDDTAPLFAIFGE